ncbi:hypothetical protein V1512DRAFT_255554 [Lipomyces arxii]|uniref:uncharacterized protein n=1 Tax=Lipomyces arxii TaxID=56418 RepID=UPI0034CEDB38
MSDITRVVIWTATAASVSMAAIAISYLHLKSLAEYLNKDLSEERSIIADLGILACSEQYSQRNMYAFYILVQRSADMLQSAINALLDVAVMSKECMSLLKHNLYSRNRSKRLANLRTLNFIILKLNSNSEARPLMGMAELSSSDLYVAILLALMFTLPGKYRQDEDKVCRKEAIFALNQLFYFNPYDAPRLAQESGLIRYFYAYALISETDKNLPELVLVCDMNAGDYDEQMFTIMSRLYASERFKRVITANSRLTQAWQYVEKYLEDKLDAAAASSIASMLDDIDGPDEEEHIDT